MAATHLSRPRRDRAPEVPSAVDGTPITSNSGSMRSRLRSLRRVATTCAVFAASFAVGRGVAPRKDIVNLAGALSDASAGVVEPRDVRWEPSSGVVTDFVFGRWALFLASATKGGPRDVWRARVRLTPEGRPLEVADAHDLTGTPLGDDHALVIDDRIAAFATYAFGQEQSVTVLDLAGEGAQNKTTLATDRAMAWVTNVQQTGTGTGVARVDVTLDSPARAIGLALKPGALAIDSADEQGVHRHATLDLAKGEIDGAGMRVEPARHLPKRFVFWAVDTARAVPWIGPAPIAWLEDRVFALRDDARQMVFKLRGADDADTLAGAGDTPKGPPPASLLDSSQAAAVDAAEWPPAAIPSIWKSAQPGEGEWVAPKLPWMKKLGESSAPPAFVRTFVRPDPERPYATVLLVAMDMRQLDLGHGGRRGGSQAAHRRARRRALAARSRRLAACRRRVQRRLQDRARQLRHDGEKAGSSPAATVGRERRRARRRPQRARHLGLPRRMSAASSEFRTTRSSRSARTSTRSSITAR